VLTNNKDYQVKDAWVAHSIDEALRLTDGDTQPFIIGGGEVYKLFLPISDKIELTRVHSSFEADAFFPEVDSTQWDLVEEEKHYSSFDQPYDYSYLTYKKKTI
jgi:dihydrofolate reductase